MNTLAEFVLDFATGGLGEVAKDIKETEQKIDSLEREEKKLNETIEKGGKEADKAREKLKKLKEEIDEQKKSLDKLNNSWEGNILKLKENWTEAAKAIGTFTALGVAVAQAVQFADNAFQISEAAEQAKKSIEEIQKEQFGKYLIFTKEDVNNAKEYEMTMRDIRMGLTAISANIGRIFLPAITAVAKTIKSITDFFYEHQPAVKMGIIAIGLALTAAFGVVLFKNLKTISGAISGIGKALWGLVANPVGIWIAAITALVVGLILVLDDLYAWFTGGESALSGFWDLVFGGVEGAKDLVDDFRKAWELILPAIKWVGDAIMWVVKGALKLFVGALILIPTLIVAIISKVLQLLAWLGKIPEKIQTILHIGTKTTGKTPDGSHADGLDYVPYDGYIAELHKGERIQTADEANNWRNGLLAAKSAVNFTKAYPLNSIPSGAVSNAYSSSSSNRTINIGDITIQTQATDSQGIAADIGQYIKQAVISLDDGMLA